MKKKLLTVLLFFALTAVSVGTFTSCKDNDEELRTEIAGNKASLEALLAKCKAECQAEWTRIDSEIKILNNYFDGGKTTWTQDQINALITEQTKLLATQEALKALEGRIKDLEDELTPERVAALITLTSIVDNLKTINDEFPGVKTDIKNLQEILYGSGTAAAPTAGSLMATVNSLVTDVQGVQAWFADFTDVDGTTPMTPARFQELVKEGAWVSTNKAALNEILNKKLEIGKLNDEALDSLNKYYTYFPNLLETQAEFNDLFNDLFPNGNGADLQLPEGADHLWSYTEMMEKILANTDSIEAAVKRISANEEAIAKLHEDLDKLFNLLSTRIDEMVTGLVLQATNNPLFGSVNTPFGINSMALVTYYGKATSTNSQFPSGVSGEEQNLGADAFDAIDWAAMMKAGAVPYSLDAEVLVNLDENNKANLGTMWFTVNPGTVDNLNVENFALVNSAEVESDVKLTNVVKDDETVLKFGFSRAAGNGNGLYQAQATVDPANLDNIKINIEPGLTEALKDAVKNRTAADMAHMAKVVYNQLQNVCDANALRYTYTSVVDTAGTERENKVYSNYGIAATAIKPLGFTTLKGVSLGHIPTIDHITIDKDLVKLDFSKFDLGDINLNVELKLGEITFDDLGNLVISVEVPAYEIVDGELVEVGKDIVYVPQDQLDKLINAIKNPIVEWIEGTGQDDSLADKINAAIAEAVEEQFNGENGVITKIENQVNDMTGTIQNKLNELVNKINSDYLGKVNRLLDKYNRVANRINNVLKNPNHYLQSAILYKTSSDLGVLSTNPKQPTQFKGNGEAIELFITTYNFEVVAPVFKKFIGVTKVTKNGVEMPELAKAANESANFGEVLNGDVNRVALNVKGATNGTYMYEVAYQAVDYMGYTSTVKAYIQVVR